jgi:hypothetical protein
LTSCNMGCHGLKIAPKHPIFKMVEGTSGL